MYREVVPFSEGPLSEVPWTVVCLMIRCLMHGSYGHDHLLPVRYHHACDYHRPFLYVIARCMLRGGREREAKDKRKREGTKS